MKLSNETSSAKACEHNSKGADLSLHLDENNNPIYIFHNSLTSYPVNSSLGQETPQALPQSRLRMERALLAQALIRPTRLREYYTRLLSHFREIHPEMHMQNPGSLLQIPIQRPAITNP